MPVPPECLFIPLRFEDTGNSLFPAFLLQSVRFAVATRRNDASASGYTISKSKMISRRQGGGDETYFTYVEEPDDAANKDSALI
jgi:hypothetical protein